jgi:hypothetical protein
MSNTKTYHSGKLSKGETLMIYWVKDKYTIKSHQELTVSFNGTYHSHDISALNRFTITSIANSYITNITFGNTRIHNERFMNDFIKTLGPIIEEFQRDVEHRYSLDGWIGRIFIEPFEDFVDWLKK